MRYGIVGFAFVVCVMLAGAFAPVHAERSSCGATLAIKPTIIKDHVFYEITGAGFPASEQVEIKAVNRRTAQGVVFTVTTNADGTLGGVAVGRDADGTYSSVAPGRWTVRARFGACAAKAEFATLEQVQEGQWGGTEASMIVKTDDATVDTPCGHGTIDQPIVLDENNRFSVTGTFVEEFGPMQQPRPAIYDGTVDGDTMTLTITLPAYGTLDAETIGPFHLQYNVPPKYTKCV